MMNKKHIIILGIGFFIFFTGKEKSLAQLTVSNALTPAQLVQNVLLGPGVIATNITFTGDVLQRGTFDATNTNLPIPSGVILSSGDINVAIGPNNSGGATMPPAGFNNPGDPDLTTIAGATTFDAAVLEFDFIPIGDTVRFNYIFASEEYLEYVNSGFNDAFGFFLSGPGIFGPYTNNAVNIALLPGGVTPVTIDNVNDVSNSAYYVDNGDGGTAPFNTDSQYIQFDGYTVVLEAVYPVQCNQTYHIKLAIADAGDAVLESGVFIESGSFSSEGIQISVTTITGDSTIIEGCTGATFIFSRPDTTSDLVVYYDIAGNAINGVDYNFLVDSIVINQGSFSSILFIFPLFDTLTEGVDTILITIYNITACGDTIPEIAIIYIVEDYVFTVTANDVTTCPGGTVALTASVSGGISPYNFWWVDFQTGDTIFGDTIYVSPLVTDTLIVTVTDSCGLKTIIDTVIVNVQPMAVSSIVSDVSCNAGNDGSATVIPSGGTPAYTYSWNTTPLQIDSMATGLTAGDYIVTVTDAAGCISIVGTTISEPDSIITIVSGETTICIGDSTIIGAFVTGGTPSYTFIWDNGLGNDSIHTVAPSSTTTYTVIVQDANGCTGAAQSVTVSTSNLLSVMAAGAATVCFGDSAIITSIAIGGDGGPYTYLWSSGAGMSDTAIVTPAITTTYVVTVTSACDSSSATDSVTITVISEIVLFTNDAIICPGKNAVLNVSGALTYWWAEENTPMDTIAIGTTVTVNPTTTTNYLVTGFDGVCEKTDTVTVTVNSPPVADFEFDPDPASMLNPSIIFINTSTGADSSWWDFGDGTEYVGFETTHTYTDTGTYAVWLIITDNLGCLDTIIQYVTIESDFILFAPNAFTPNRKDDINDVFIPKGIGIDVNSFKMYIYDRWGNEIFETTDFFQGWDGTANNGRKIAQQDVYIWLILTKDMKGKRHKYLGHVTLIR